MLALSLLVAASFAACPDCHYNITQLLESRGYPCEQYWVENAKGYLLSVQRIPHGRDDTNAKRTRPPVLMQHGFADLSTTFLNNEFPSENPAEILADAGFDVWISGSVGDTYDHKHKTLSPDSDEFWNWSWSDEASYSLPLLVSFVLKTNGAPNLTYIGHSQGSMVGFAEFPLNPQLSHQVNLFIALSPIAYVRHIAVKAITLIADYMSDSLLYDFIGHQQTLSSKTWLLDKAPFVCELDAMACEFFYCQIAGCPVSNSHLNATRFPAIMANYPGGTPAKNFAHFIQGARSGTFAKYDYGSAQANEKHYGQPTAPEYHPNGLDIPTILISGSVDKLADPTDVAYLRSLLRDDIIVYEEQVKGYGHADPMWAVDAHELVWAKLLPFMKEFAA